MSDAKIRAIIKRPDEKYGHVSHISNALKAFQKIVDGYIETVPFGNNMVIICNEEGKIRNLERNFIMGTPPFHDVIRGTVAIVGVDGEEFCDCPLDFGVWKGCLERWGNL